MDLSFLRRGFAGGSAAGLDYRLLLAALQGVQASSPAARAEGQREPEARAPVEVPIADILLGASGWREAVVAQRGCFNFGQAQRVGKAVAIQMTEEFTFAF